MKEKIMDIRRAIDNECFLSALALALTLPDICGKVEFPNVVGKKVYIDWFDKYVFPYYKDNSKHADKYAGTEFDGQACYSLRCAYLHLGNADLREQNSKLKINQFDLCFSSNKDSGIYVDMHGVSTSNWSNEKIYSVRLDVRKLCKTLCDAAENYYNSYQDKELFKEHEIHIINLEKEMRRINSNYKPITDIEIEKALEELQR